MIESISKWWPERMDTSPAPLQASIHEAIGSLNETAIKGAIDCCNKALRGAIAQDNATTEHKYRDFLKQSLAGSAGTAHALLKAFEKDNGTSYEVIDDIRASTQGVSIKDRMTTRCCQWGVDKWDVVRPDRQKDLQLA